MPERKQIIKWSMLLGKLLVLGLLIWTIKGTLVKAFDDLSQHDWQVDWRWLVATGAIYLLGTLPSGLFWNKLIAAADHPVPPLPSIRAFYVSQIGKYVPGKAMVLILRAGMMRPLLVPATVVTAGVFYETLTTMAVGSFVALVALLPQVQEQRTLVLAALGGLAITGLPTLPPVFKFALRYSGVGRIDPAAVKKLSRIGPRVLAGGWLGIGLGWCLHGLSLWATLRALGADTGSPLVHWPLYTAVVALSVVAGFLALIPAGVGAREWVTIELLKPLYGDTVAVVSAILLRLVSVVADVGISTILYMVRPRGTTAESSLADEPDPAQIETSG